MKVLMPLRANRAEGAGWRLRIELDLERTQRGEEESDVRGKPQAQEADCRMRSDLDLERTRRGDDVKASAAKLTGPRRPIGACMRADLRAKLDPERTHEGDEHLDAHSRANWARQADQGCTRVDPQRAQRGDEDLGVHGEATGLTRSTGAYAPSSIRPQLALEHSQWGDEDLGVHGEANRAEEADCLACTCAERHIARLQRGR